jgi:myo-inositol-1(or 4)-monophosphatase
VLVREAGGIVSRYDGSAFTIDSRETLATNGVIHEELRALMDDIFAGRNMESLPSPQDYAKQRAEREKTSR